MNWQLIGWFFGGVLTIYAIKFILELFKSLLGKDARADMMESIGESIHNANKSLTRALKRKAEERRRQKEEENKPMIMIR